MNLQSYCGNRACQQLVASGLMIGLGLVAGLPQSMLFALVAFNLGAAWIFGALWFEIRKGKWATPPLREPKNRA